MREGEADFSQREVDATLALLIDTQAWIQRRTDRVELIDTYTLRRSIRFEIELPEWAHRAVSETDCRLILPIGVFGGGQALRNLEVSFGQEPAGTLTRHAGDRLTALLRERLKKNGDLGIPESARHFLDDLLQLDAEGAEKTGRGGYRKGNYVLFVTSDKPISGAVDAGSRFVVTLLTDQTLVRSLGADEQPPSISKALRAIGLGRVSATKPDADSGSGWLRDVWLRTKRTAARTAALLFPTDYAFVLAQTFSGFGDARSWQLEIYAPTELRISDGALIWWPNGHIEEGDGDTPGKEEPPSTKKEVTAPAAMSNGEALSTRRATSMVALTRFRVQADSIIHIGFLVTLATTALLAVAIGIALEGTAGPIVDAVVAILVIAPSLGASIVTNPENHEMAGDFLKPIRQRIYLVGFFAALAAALFIVFGLTPGNEECLPVKDQVPLVEVQVGALLDDCQADKVSSWQEGLGGAIASWNTAGKVTFGLMVATFLLLLLTAFSFLKIQRDKSLRNQRSVEILSRGERPEKDLRPEVFLETTADERNKRGIRGRSRSIRNSRRAEEDHPLLTLSTDAIDLGPRAIFRAPPSSKDLADIHAFDQRRVEERTLEGGTRDQRERAKKKIPGLFDRFFYGTWIHERPPDWFFWSSDIEADYIRDDLVDGQKGDGKPERAASKEAPSESGEVEA